MFSKQVIATTNVVDGIKLTRESLVLQRRIN